jgi:hypothetical protein
MKKKPRNLLKQYQTEYQGSKVTVNVLKPKQVKGVNHARRSTANCPNCNSSLIVNDNGLYECSSDKLVHWDKEFYKYYMMSPPEKVEYLATISRDSMFFDLYDKWVFARENESPEDYTCGYTNIIFLPIGSNKTIIPDPMYVGFLEKRLKRPLTEEEIRNESELWIKGKRVFTEYRKGARMVKIPYIIFPDLVEVKV